MRKKLINLWRDPVLSAASGALLYAAIMAMFQNAAFGQAIRRLWTLKFDLWIYLSALSLFIVVYELLKRTKRFQYDEKTLELDRTLFSHIRKEEFLFDSEMHWLRYQDFGAPFKSERLIAISKIVEENDKPHFEFMHPKLERQKKQLVNAIGDFDECIGRYVFGDRNDRVRIPPEWEYKQRERFEKALQETDEKRKEVCKRYGVLVKEGRRLLKV